MHLSCKGVALSASQSHAFRAVYSITCTCVCTVHCRLGAVCRRACLQCTRLQLRGAKLCQVRHRLHLCSHAAGTAALRQQRLHHARAQYGKSRVGRHITNAFFATPRAARQQQLRASTNAAGTTTQPPHDARAPHILSFVDRRGLRWLNVNEVEPRLCAKTRENAPGR